MTKEIIMTKDGGFYYRAKAFHFLFTYPILIPALVILIFAIVNPFWFREDFMRWCEKSATNIAQYRDKIKYRIYLGTDPEVWHALKDRND